MKDKQKHLNDFGLDLGEHIKGFRRPLALLTPDEKRKKAYEKAQKIQKLAFYQLLDLLLSSVDIPQPERKVGHPYLSLKDVLFCCAAKVFLCVSSRRLMTELHSLRDENYLEHIPSHSIINAYMRNKDIIPIIQEMLRMSVLPMKELIDTVCIDSSGFSNRRYISWQDARLNPSKHHKWVKAHVAICDKSFLITAAHITKSSENDTKFFKPLLKESIQQCKHVKFCCADAGYSSKENFRFARALNVDAYIDFKGNTIYRKLGATEWDKKFRQFCDQPEEYKKKYSRRSLVESAFHMVKAKHLQKIYARDFWGAVVESYLKCLIHNLYVLTVHYCEQQMNKQNKI